MLAWSSLVAQQIKDPGLSLQQLRSLLWQRFNLSITWELPHASGTAKKDENPNSVLFKNQGSQNSAGMPNRIQGAIPCVWTPSLEWYLRAKKLEIKTIEELSTVSDTPVPLLLFLLNGPKKHRRSFQSIHPVENAAKLQLRCFPAWKW